MFVLPCRVATERVSTRVKKRIFSKASTQACHRISLCKPKHHEPESSTSYRSICDAGFTRGCAAGYEWGLLQGAASTLKVFAGQVQGTGVPEVNFTSAILSAPC